MTASVLRVDAFAKATGYKPATIRKMIQDRRLDYHKVGRCIVIPEREVQRILGQVVRREST